MTSDNSKISGLWQQFYLEVAPLLAEESRIMGVYCNYESDFSGEFDVVAATDKLEGNFAGDSVTLQSGRYLVFAGKGSMPQAVINAWFEIWDYFSSGKPEHTRAYTTDFELYKSDSEVQVFIAIK